LLCTYTGTDSRMYMDYRDAFTGRSLEASPGGGPYDIEVVSGAGLPLPPGDGRWTVIEFAAGGVIETPAPDVPPPSWEAAPPVPAAEPEPAAPVTPEEAGSGPAEVES
jgi:hypothetical protein